MFEFGIRKRGGVLKDQSGFGRKVLSCKELSTFSPDMNFVTCKECIALKTHVQGQIKITGFELQGTRFLRNMTCFLGPSIISDMK